jgi:hypothetical protein
MMTSALCCQPALGTATWLEELSSSTPFHLGDVLWLGTESVDGDLVPGEVIDVEISSSGVFRHDMVAEAPLTTRKQLGIMPRVAPITGKSDVAPEYHDVVDDVLKVFGQVRVPFSMLLCIAPSRPSRW